MEKNNKYKYLKLCLASEVEREAKNVHKGAIIISIALTVLAVCVAGIMVYLFM